MFDSSILDFNSIDIALSTLSGDSFRPDTIIASGSVTQEYDTYSTQAVPYELSSNSRLEVVSANLLEAPGTGVGELVVVNQLETVTPSTTNSTDEVTDALTGIAEDTPWVGSSDFNEPGNTLASAYDLGILNGSLGFSEWVGHDDTYDFYRFELNTTSNLSCTLDGLSANADVQLIQDINNDGLADASEVLAGSYTQGITSEFIDRNLAPGVYYIQVSPYNHPTNYSFSLTTAELTPSFSLFNFTDAAGDSTASSVFQGGAIRFSYQVEDAPFLSNVGLEAWSNGAWVANLGTWNQASLANQLVNLAGTVNLTGGDYQLRAVASTTDGEVFASSFQAMTVLSGSQISGTFAGETLSYWAGLQTGTVVFGQGGTDTLDLAGLYNSDILSLNGQSLSAFNPFNSTASQAIFEGTAFDYLTLADGREIYFQGIENLQFADGSTLELQVRPNDTHFGFQWNLHVSDVPNAWRFAQGSDDVLLVSLDSGILTAQNADGDIVDISTSRLITDATDDDNYGNYGHGHSAISVMASEANNGSGIAGINWNSQVMVHDVYGRSSQSGVTLMQAIEETISYARANNKRVVFQGGIQGEYWLTHSFYRGGTRSRFEQLIRDNADIAIFAIAAGNGGPGGNLNDPNYLSSVAGVAKLEATHSNVMSVGAVQAMASVDETQQWQTEWINGLMNATTLNIAPYSNRGSNLTLVAPTDSPAIDKFSELRFFSGTSAANPNLAGIASLVWSVNPTLTGSEIRQILIETAMDLGSEGRDNTFGYGLVDADAAVRRAVALARDAELANIGITI